MRIITIFIKNDNNKLLIQKRSVKKNGKYAFTSGHIKENETSLQGAIRELKEELGVKINEIELELFFTKKIYTNIYDLYYLKKDININQMKIQKEEVQKVMWLSLGEIENLIEKNLFFNTQIEALEIFKRYVRE